MSSSSSSNTNNVQSKKVNEKLADTAQFPLIIRPAGTPGVSPGRIN